MEYLLIIAFVGIMIFKAIKKGNEANKEEAGKTMLPGKRAIVIPENKKKPDFSDSWEEWFDDKKPKQTVLAVEKTPSSTVNAKNKNYPSKNSYKQEIAVAHEKTTNHEETIRLDSKEKLRRAIIYSEILNRKY